MPVLRLIGDEWKFNEKIAISIPPAKSFLMCATQLKEKLQIPSWTGCALYWTEGKPPNYVRATVPISLNSTPGREGMKDGTMLYVKSKSTQAQQELDREFHEALIEWRKANRIEGILSDGSDVFEFMDEYASKLKPSDARDIAEHESEKRAVVQGEEHRAFFVVTFEYREVQNLKDKETAARALIDEAFFSEWRAAYRQLFWIPRCLHLQQAVQRIHEPSKRDTIATEEVSSRSNLEAEHRRTIADQRALLEQRALTQQQSAPTVHQTSLPSMSSAYVTGDMGDRLSLLELSLKNETSQIRGLMTGLMSSFSQANEHLAQSYESMSTSLEKQFLRNLEGSLKATIALKEQDARAPLDREEEIQLERKIKALKALIEEEIRQTEDQRINIAKTECDVVHGIASAVLAEQDHLRQAIDIKMRQLSETENALRVAENENMELGRLLKLHHVLLQHQDVELDQYKATLLQYEERVRYGKAATTSFAVNEVRWSKLSSSTYRSTAGLHPDVYSTCIQVVQRRESIPQQIYTEVLGYPLGFPARTPDPLSPEERLIHDDAVVRNSTAAVRYFKGIVDEISLVAQGCPYQVGDELCFRYRIPSHPLRKQYIAVVDDDHPHLAGVLDALLDVFAGREAELMLFLTGVRWSAGEFLPCWDGSAQRYYYHHPRCQITQWTAPDHR
jgi:hypothetical protein